MKINSRKIVKGLAAGITLVSALLYLLKQVMLPGLMPFTLSIVLFITTMEANERNLSGENKTNGIVMFLLFLSFILCLCAMVSQLYHTVH